MAQLLIAAIGITTDHLPPHLPQLATPELVSGLLPERPIYGHKGTFGKALVVAGCLNYTGAPYLSAMAAYRVGAGLVTLAVTPPVQAIVAPKLTEATYLRLPHDEGATASPAAQTLAQSLKGYSALLVGPGLGQAGATAQFLTAALPHLGQIPRLLDADALHLRARYTVFSRVSPLPHVKYYPRRLVRSIRRESFEQPVAGTLQAFESLTGVYVEIVVGDDPLPPGDEIFLARPVEPEFPLRRDRIGFGVHPFPFGKVFDRVRHVPFLENDMGKARFLCFERRIQA